MQILMQTFCSSNTNEIFADHLHKMHGQLPKKTNMEMFLKKAGLGVSMTTEIFT